MTKKIKRLIAASFAFAFAVIAYRGFQMPWSEEGVLYAIYGGAVGFYAATALSMATAWALLRKKSGR